MVAELIHHVVAHVLHNVVVVRRIAGIVVWLIIVLGHILSVAFVFAGDNLGFVAATGLLSVACASSFCAGVTSLFLEAV